MSRNSVAGVRGLIFDTDRLRSGQKATEKDYNLFWLGQHSLIIKSGEKHIYIDPLNLKDDEQYPEADYVVITYDHENHLNLESVSRVSTENTVIMAPVSSRDIIKKVPYRKKIMLLQVGQTVKFRGGISFQALPARPQPHDLQFSSESIRENEEASYFCCWGILVLIVGLIIAHYIYSRE